MDKTTYQKIVKNIGVVAIAAGIFLLGAFVGTHNTFVQKIFPNAATASDAVTPQADLSEFWSVWHLMEQKYPFVKTAPKSDDKVYGAISGLVASYGDPYTMFFPPKEAKLFNAQVKGSFGGVGMEVGMKDGFITVIAPIKDSPAEKAGIQSGDIVIKIDGKKTDGMEVDTAIGLIRGDVGKPVTLTVARSGATEPKNITIVRDVVHTPVIDTKTVGDTFVISLYSFTADSADLFHKAIGEFQKSGKTKLIIDLRNNPGGYLDAAVDIASYFLPAGTTIVRENSGVDHPEIVHQSKGFTDITKKIRVALLVNGGSASASEILAGALSEGGVAKLVGTTTFGKGSVQEVIDLKDGSSVKITVAKWLTPNGVSISEKGITPGIIIKDIPTKDPKTGVIKDPQLDAAIKALK